MKRFLAISLILSPLVLHPSSLYACGWEGPSHNNYMFSVFPREMMGDLFSERLNEFWKPFADNEATDYRWNKNRIRENVERRGDRELLNYMDMLDAYLDISQQLGDTWNYPTKEQLQERQARLESMITAADNYRGQRLKPQYQLLRMRANMVLGRHQANKTFYEQTVNAHLSSLPSHASVYRDMMRNIYAGALLHLGQRQQACDIYAEQGDMVSIKWCTRKHRNLAGIQQLYNENPNSPTLLWLVQDFVNNAQETLDSVDEEWIKEIGANPVYKAEVMRFIDFANQVAADGKSHSPALWKAAAGTLHYLFGDDATAVDELTEAMTLDGTQRMKDNARAIRIIAQAALSPLPSLQGGVGGKSLSELQWLDSKITEERGSKEYYSNHYTDIKDRLCHQILYPKYKKSGKLNVALAALGMMSEDDLPFDDYNYRSPAYKGDKNFWNNDYGSEFFCHLDSLSAEQLVGYYRYAKSQPSDLLERYFLKQVYADDDYFCDLIGTRYMAEGNFKAAVEWLQRVPLGFLSKQNIGCYMVSRSPAKAKWLEDQYLDEDSQEGAGRVTFTANPKLQYCKSMLELESRYQMANETAKTDIAYELAKRYYQASYLGDCWYLTHYGWSCADTVRTGEKDFVATAIDYLNVAKNTTDPKRRQAVLYALAYIPLDPWATVDYDWSSSAEIIIPHPQSRQYRALQQLATYVRNNPCNVEPYIARCDLLKQFR